MWMSTCEEKQNKVTLLHKGMGPRLFQYRGEPFPVHYQDVVHTRTCSGPQSLDLYTPKRTIYKCVEGKEANYMYRKRLEYEKNPPKLYYSKGGSCTPTRCDAGVIRTKREIQRQMAKEQKTELEQLTSKQASKTEIRQPKGFPPPSFMPQWNPRKMDRTYLDRMVLEDPWSLSSNQRAEIQKKTGLRLKTISKHYQFKVASNLTYGREALKKKCGCYVNFCDHCNKSHEYRCPLHMQWLDPLQADCKLEVLKVCPVFQKRPEEMKLDEIQDVSVYISEVVRRLKTGEICETPPFPARFNMKKPVQEKPVQESSSLLDTSKKAPMETEGTQTDEQDPNVRTVIENVAQTMRPLKDEPMMLTTIKSLEHEFPFKPYPANEEKEVQVARCDAPTGELQDYFKWITQYVSKKILTQSIQEVADEMTINSYEKERREYEQECLDMERRFEFTIYQETFRMNAHLQQKIDLEVELGEDAIVEYLLGAIAFSRSFMSTLPAKAMQAFWSLGPGGVPINEDVKPFMKSLNHQVKKNLIHRAVSKDLLKEMTEHALFDLELDYFRRHMVDAKYLNPVYITTKSIRELVQLREKTILTLQKIREILLKQNLFPNEALATVDLLIENIRVSVDSHGFPKYLVDATGTKLPINLAWVPILDAPSEVDENSGTGTKSSGWDSGKKFDILLESDSLNSTASSKERDEEEDDEEEYLESNEVSSSRNNLGTAGSLQVVIKKDFRYDDDDDDDYIDQEHNDDGKLIFRGTLADLNE